jgi:HSP20 family protein
MTTTNTPTKSPDVRWRSPWGEPGPWLDLTPWTTPMQELAQQLWPSWAMADFSPAGELHEDDDGFVLELELPGVDKKDVTIDITSRRLRIHGTTTTTEKKGVLRHSTRASGTFSYELVVPQPVREADVTATLRDGVLTVTMPKADEVRTTRVDIG